MPFGKKLWCALAAVLSASALSLIAPAVRAQTVEQLRNLSIDQLTAVNVFSVSKQSESLLDAPASIYVITHDDIIRSGATSIPEMLRLAPNLQVAQINATSYAITARGFNLYAADKLLVMIDGRSVYSPFFQGVFWDVQDVPPEDIDRIEVISGPGNTLWGANAVNGVINIITRNAKDTQGALLDLGGGNLLRRGAAQYGGKYGDNLAYRVYGEGFDHSSSRLVAPPHASARDAWHKPQGGFRVDWTPNGDHVLVEGNAYVGSEEQITGPNQTLSGQNLTFRWDHSLENGAFQVQAYYDGTRRFVTGNGGDKLDVYDVDLQHNFSFSLLRRHDIVWGAGYRLSHDHFFDVFDRVPATFFLPPDRNLNLGDVFVQDSIALTDTISLIPGFRLEYDPYVEFAPIASVHLSWKPVENNIVWAGVSRAVRAPSREDRDLYETIGPFTFLSGSDFKSEKLISYELGYRTQPLPALSFSISSYYNVYQDLRDLEFSSNGTLPVIFANDMQGDTYGVEAWASYHLTNWWRLDPGIVWLHENLSFKPGSAGLGGIAAAGNDPTHQLRLRSTMDLPHNTSLAVELRRIGRLRNPTVQPYTEMNASIGWQATPNLHFSLTGANLLHASHQEFVSASFPATRVGRSVFFNVRVTY